VNLDEARASFEAFLVANNLSCDGFAIIFKFGRWWTLTHDKLYHLIKGVWTPEGEPP
jgi:hypothetical protein